MIWYGIFSLLLVAAAGYLYMDLRRCRTELLLRNNERDIARAGEKFAKAGEKVIAASQEAVTVQWNDDTRRLQKALTVATAELELTRRELARFDDPRAVRERLLRLSRENTARHVPPPTPPPAAVQGVRPTAPTATSELPTKPGIPSRLPPKK